MITNDFIEPHKVNNYLAIGPQKWKSHMVQTIKAVAHIFYRCLGQPYEFLKRYYTQWAGRRNQIVYPSH